MSPDRRGTLSCPVRMQVQRLFVVSLLAGLVACGEQRPRLRFRPVVDEAVRLAQSALPSETPPPAADFELTARVRTLAETLAAEQGLMRPLLALAVKDHGDAAVPVLAQMLADASLAAELRSASAELLATLDSPAAVTVLAFHAGSNPVSWVRAQCAWRLESTTQDQVVPELIVAIADERDVEARRYLARTLAHFGCPGYGVEITDEREPSRRLELAVWRTIERLKSTRGPQESERLVALIGALPTSAAKFCIAALADLDPRIRGGSARALGAMGPRALAAGPALLVSLLDDPAIEAQAIEGLGGVHFSSAGPEIETRLADRGRGSDVRLAAARALGRLEIPRAVEVLTEASSEPAPLGLVAAGALCRLGRADVGLDVLLEGLTHGDTALARRELEGWLTELDRRGLAAARRVLDQGAALATDGVAYAQLLRAARTELVH